jgi:hypothetical protein
LVHIILRGHLDFKDWQKEKKKEKKRRREDFLFPRIPLLLLLLLDFIQSFESR